jgi:hypothetical protein
MLGIQEDEHFANFLVHKIAGRGIHGLELLPEPLELGRIRGPTHAAETEGVDPEQVLHFRLPQALIVDGAEDGEDTGLQSLFPAAAEAGHGINNTSGSGFFSKGLL